MMIEQKQKVMFLPFSRSARKNENTKPNGILIPLTKELALIVYSKFT
jgi:hypothetical protein